MGLKDSRPKAQASLEIQLLDFLYGEWGASEEDKSFFRYVHLLNVGPGTLVGMKCPDEG